MSVNVVICAGARTDIQDKKGRTPLQLAKEYRKEEVHEDTHIHTPL